MTALFTVLLALQAAAAPAGPSPQRPVMAVVIDDFGLSYKRDQPDADWMALKFPVTFAVMPDSPRTKKAAEQTKAGGHELIIHFPFDPFLRLALPGNRADPGDVHAVEALLAKAFRQITGPVGLNNHRSLRATRNRPLMAAFMQLLKPRGVYFLDSHVSPQSVACDEARKAGVPAVANGLFLDGYQEPKGRRSKDSTYLAQTIARDKAICVSRLRTAAAQARKTGAAVVIGHHYFHGTYQCLVEEAPKLQAGGIELVFASALAR